MNADAVGKILDALAERFGATGATLWEALLRQVYVDSAVAAVMAVVSGAALWKFVFAWRVPFHAWVDDGSYDRDVAVPFAYFAAVAVGIFCLVNTYLAMHMFNPTFYALQYVLQAVKP